MFKSILCSLCLLVTTSVFAKNPVILISIDGFAHKYLTMYKPPFITSMMNKGAASAGLKPVYPSKTFPNHLSMVTGEYPAQHGIVHNRFYHRQLKTNYTLGAGKKDQRWLLAKPIWTLAELTGIKTGVYFWPESEAKISGVYPSYYFPYQHNTPNKDRLDELIRWLKLPQKERPQLLITYFSTVDSAGHEFGTQSTQLKNEIIHIDKLLAEFDQRIKLETGLTPNIVLVSDHGMVDIDSQLSIKTRALLKPFPQLRIVNGETQLYVYEKSTEKLAQVKKHLLSLPQADLYQVYLKEEFPRHWQLQGENLGIPDMIVDAIAPSIFVKHNFLGYKNSLHKATHGYDAVDNRDLDAIFIAKGPDINRGVSLPKFQNLLVFDLLKALLQLESENTNARNAEQKELIMQVIKVKSE